MRLLLFLNTFIAGLCIPAAKAEAAPRVQRVVLVHGIFGKSSQLDPVRKRLEKHGIECLSPSLRPADARDGLDVLAVQLKREIEDRFGPRQPVAIIAYSMGGLVGRHYLQHLGGAGRCSHFITISSPHHGSGLAWCYPGKGAWQMRPGSEFLSRLAASEQRLENIPVVSYRTPLDLVILPSTSSVWERAENLEFTVAMHPLMLRSGKVLRDIERRLLE